MTKEQASKIKKILKKENAVFVDCAGYYNGEELRVKVAEYMEASKLNLNLEIDIVPTKQKEAETRDHIIKVLRALERNGLRPKYRLEQRNTANAYATYDSRYVIFR